MSASGQKATFWESQSMSGLPPKADVRWTKRTMSASGEVSSGGSRLPEDCRRLTEMRAKISIGKVRSLAAYWRDCAVSSGRGDCGS